MVQKSLQINDVTQGQIDDLVRWGHGPHFSSIARTAIDRMWIHENERRLRMTRRMSDSDLYDLYVEKSTTFAEIAVMDIDTLAEQIAELQLDDVDVDARDAAERIQEYAERELLRKATERVDNDPALEPYRDLLAEYDWQEAAQHLAWVCSAQTNELIDWAQSIRDDDSEHDRIEEMEQ